MSTLTTIQSTDLITNSRTVINNNFSALNTDKMETSVLDTDTTLAANSDSKVATQKAVKAYVDGVGVATATTTVKGTVEVATQAQVTAGTALGETGASIVVTPATLMGITTPVVRTYLNSGSPHTWTKPTGLKYIIAEVVGGGGGGGGDTTDVAAGGGGGGYSKKLIAAASLGTTETVTVGAGGVGTYNAETAGGTTSFGSHLSATGGNPGTTDQPDEPGTGGVGSSGDININGASGDIGSTTFGISGMGGNSFYGVGGAGQKAGGAGNPGLGYGGGGSGADSGGADTAGGAGTQGICIVTEYYV